MNIKYASLQGKRDENEDQHIIIQNLDNQNPKYNNIDIIGVFDGHGGKLVSKYAKKILPKYFLKKNDKLFNSTKYTNKYISKVFNKFNKLLNDKYPRASLYSGSTCCLAIIHKSKNNNKNLWIVNVGDSRAVLSRNKSSKQLSFDHKPNTPLEKKRITKLGGAKKIKYDGYDWRILNLSLSRALGDLDSHPYITPLPQVYKYKLRPSDNFIVLGCDGLWDVFSNQAAINFVSQNIHHNNIAKLLAQEAINKGSTDNVTTIIYPF